MFMIKGSRPSLRTETVAGVTTFLTMAYIVVVNPGILAEAGVPYNTAFIATIIAALVGTLLMAFFANYPIAIAPGMGMNAYFAFSVAQPLAERGGDYRVAFSTVFLAAILFVLISLTPLRTRLIEAIPNNLKHSIAAGIGLFIAFIGLRSTGIIQASDATLVTLGTIHDGKVLLALAGLFITLILMALRVFGALFIGMIITTILALLTGQMQLSGEVVSLPPMPELVAYNPIQAVGDMISYGLYAAVASFVLITLFDTTGTVLGLAKQADLMEGNKLPRAGRAMLSDALATLAGSVFGTSPTSTYIESATGIAAGGRTGLTALVIAVLLVITAFFSPLVGVLSGVAAITGPALIIVGALMVSNVRFIEWDHFDDVFPAFIVILSMPLTSSIATGLAAGFIFFPLMKVFAGKWREVHPLVYIFGVLFLIDIALVGHI